MISGNDLTDEQKQAVAAWAEDGQSLGDIQDGLSKEFGIKCTYMNMHLLMIDLGVSLKEEEEPEPEPEPEPQPAPEAAPVPDAAPEAQADPAPDQAPAPDAAAPGETPDGPAAPSEELPPASDVNVQVSISDVAIPNAMASGSVTFSDGEVADWMVDQLGRLALDPKTPGYQPDEANVVAFQQELQRLARSQGM